MTSGLIALFFGSLLASTVVPGGVEVLLYYMVEQGRYSFGTLWLVASLGNTIGGCISFAMGWLLRDGIHRYKHRWPMLQRMSDRFQLQDSALSRVTKWGPAALLMSWMPIVGDPLCIAAGFLKLSWWRCLLAIAIGKVGRYWVLLTIFYQ